MEAGRESTTFDILRTKVQLMMQKNKWSGALAVTSPTPGCGKTTTACNLALGLSRQKGVRTILVELDLSRPMIAKMLGFDARTTSPRCCGRGRL
jgi:protein-tyrosine kinase